MEFTPRPGARHSRRAVYLPRKTGKAAPDQLAEITAKLKG